jgi:transcriptional regulator with XRE-family HTH domain
MTERNLRPSEVFAARLREVRNRRGLSQDALAQQMTDSGRPLSKAALLRIEKGKGFEEGGRGLLLDEALALAVTLNAAPAHLLSPPGDGGYVMLTDKLGMDADAVRDWLTLGLVGFEPAPESQRQDRARARFQERMAQLAVAFIDAGRSDRAGAQAVLDAIVRSVDDYRREVEVAEAYDRSLIDHRPPDQ